MTAPLRVIAGAASRTIVVPAPLPLLGAGDAYCIARLKAAQPARRSR
jgi:hypothetical protein